MRTAHFGGLFCFCASVKLQMDRYAVWRSVRLPRRVGARVDAPVARPAPPTAWPCARFCAAAAWIRDARRRKDRFATRRPK